MARCVRRRTLLRAFLLIILLCLIHQVIDCILTVVNLTVCSLRDGGSCRSRIERGSFRVPARKREQRGRHRGAAADWKGRAAAGKDEEGAFHFAFAIEETDARGERGGERVRAGRGDLQAQDLEPRVALEVGRRLRHLRHLQSCRH